MAAWHNATTERYAPMVGAVIQGIMAIYSWYKFEQMSDAPSTFIAKIRSLRLPGRTVAFVVGTMLALYQIFTQSVGLPQNFTLGLIACVGIAACFVVLVFGINGLGRGSKAVLSLIGCFVLFVYTVNPLKVEWKREDTPSSPGPVLIPTYSGPPFSARLRLLFDDEKDVWFWVKNGDHVCPARVGVYLTITDLLPRKAQLADLSLEAMSNRSTWIKMPSINFTHDSQFLLGKSPNVWIDILDYNLFDLLQTQPLEPGVPLKGWLFFDNPLGSQIRVVRVRVSDTTGTAFTSEPLIAESGDLEDSSFTATGKAVDLRSLTMLTHCGE